MERPSPDSFRAMAGWFSRRSGSRVSIQNPVRRVLRAPSLSRNPMPPRTTRKSDRRKASDRTMVGLAQPVCLSASGIKRRRYESTMNLRKRKIHRGSFQYGGWTARPFSLCLAVAGEEFVLTSPLQKPLHVCANVIRKPSLLAFFLRNSICCRRYLCS